MPDPAIEELDECPEVPINNPPTAPVIAVSGPMRVTVSAPFIVVRSE